MNAYVTSQGSGVLWPPVPVLPPPLGTPQPGRSDYRPHQLEPIGPGVSRLPSARPLIDEVREHYVLETNAVGTILANHPNVAQVLLDAAPVLKEYFGSRTIFKLRPSMDEAGGRPLYVVVIWPGAVNDVRNSLGKFDGEWWISRSTAMAGRLIVTYELV